MTFTPPIKRYIDQLYGIDEILDMICDPLTNDISSKVTKSQTKHKKRTPHYKGTRHTLFKSFPLREQELECILSNCYST